MMYLHRPRFSLMKMVSSLKKAGSHLCRHLPSASILAQIERKVYRIQIEGYMQEDPRTLPSRSSYV